MENKNEMGETDIIVLDDDGIRVGEKPAVYRCEVFFSNSGGYRLLLALILQKMIISMLQKLISISVPQNMVSNMWLSGIQTK